MRQIDGDALLAAYDAAHKGPPGGARKLIEQAPTIEAVPIKPLCEWLAAYAAPPKYALEAICNDIDPASIVYTANDRARAWEYHWKHLMDCGLMEVDSDPN